MCSCIRVHSIYHSENIDQISEVLSRPCSYCEPSAIEDFNRTPEKARPVAYVGAAIMQDYRTSHDIVRGSLVFDQKTYELLDL